MEIQAMANPSTNPVPDAEFVRRRRDLGGRRSFISFSMAVVASSLTDSIDSRRALLQEYLERSKQNKAKYDKERLDDYNKRNYKDYFNLVEGSLEGKKEEQLTESEKGIREWLRRNK